ncbi:MAG: ribonuclease P protein component [Phycisphaerales bacterium]
MPSLSLPRARLLRHDLEFQAVYRARMKKAGGGVALFTMPNGRSYHRLGLAVAKRGGTAIARNRVKRLVREAWRLEQHGFCGGQTASEPPRCYDMVVSATASAAETLTLDGVRCALRELVALSDRAWVKRGSP